MKKLLAALLTLILLCAPALAASELEIASALDAALAEHLPSGYTLDVSTSYATVSYTHLDVYKRQVLAHCVMSQKYLHLSALFFIVGPSGGVAQCVTGPRPMP